MSYHTIHSTEASQTPAECQRLYTCRTTINWITGPISKHNEKFIVSSAATLNVLQLQPCF